MPSKSELSIIGLVLITGMILIGIFFQYIANSAEVVTGYGGEDKISLFDDPELNALLEERYKFGISMYPTSTRAILEGNYPYNRSYLLTSSSFSGEKFKLTGVSNYTKDEIFTSPLVLYSWDTVVDTLVSLGIAHKITDYAYTVDFELLVEMSLAGVTWDDLGLESVDGIISVSSSDPIMSDSGNLLVALVSYILNDNQVIQKEDVGSVSGAVSEFFRLSGYNELSSADVFNEYLRTGVNGKPIVALCENILIEYAALHPQDWDTIKHKVRVLYPTPAVISRHVYLSMTNTSGRFLTILQDDDVQRIIWERHGFRVGTTGISVLNSDMESMGIMSEVTKIVSLPDYETILSLLSAIDGTQE